MSAIGKTPSTLNTPPAYRGEACVEQNWMGATPISQPTKSGAYFARSHQRRDGAGACPAACDDRRQSAFGGRRAIVRLVLLRLEEVDEVLGRRLELLQELLQGGLHRRQQHPSELV